MTNELEKQFFDTFGIEPREFKSCDVGTFCPYPEKECGSDTCPYYRTYKIDYPQITDRILLELICIANHKDVYIDFEGTDIETIKNSLLENFIFFRRDVEKYVKKLFKEGKKC